MQYIAKALARTELGPGQNLAVCAKKCAMGYFSAIWDLEDDPNGNVQHIAEHGVTQDEVEEVLENPLGIDRSDSSGRPIAFGRTSTGRTIAVVYEEVDRDTVYPITAYEVEM